MVLRLKRIYEEPSIEDGTRILVDRLWPRGISKERAKVDLWLKEIAPSPGLRKWYAHRPEKHEEFKALYLGELSYKTKLLEEVGCIVNKGDVTLVYAAKDPIYNHVVILKEYLEQCLTKGK